MSVGREKMPFKLDVRKLKEMGLTESLVTGYRLSPLAASRPETPGLGLVPPLSGAVADGESLPCGSRG